MQMKLSTKIVAYLGGFFMGLLAIPGVGDFLANAVTSGFSIAVHAYPKLTIFSVAALAIAAWLRSPHKAPSAPVQSSASVAAKSAAILLCVGLTFGTTGCSADQASQVAVNAIQLAINVANAEIASVPAAEQPAYKAYVGTLQTLNTQLASCNGSVKTVSLSRSAKFLACFNAFATGATSPSELAALRVLSPTTQGRVQAVITAVIIAVNAVLPAIGGAPVTTPVVSATFQLQNAPITSQLVPGGAWSQYVRASR